MIPKIKNSFEIGSGYSSDIGFRSKIIWRKPWINTYGHSLENILSLSILEQSINMNYKIPLLVNSIEQYYLIQVGWINKHVYNVQSQIATFNITRYWSCFTYWKSMINLNWYINRYCIQKNHLINTIMLICPGIGISRIQKYDESVSCWKNSQRYSINISTKYWGSDLDFVILQAQNIWMRTFFERNRILIRNNFSWMETDSISSCIMPSVRCFFTKDYGIRGYEYEFISSFGHLKYTKLLTTTIEYKYNFFDKWWSVIFLDIGEITNNIEWENIKCGTGIGIHWQLPIGPIRLDIAIPLINKFKINHKFFYFYINLGPEL